jgi:hypothetical protein
VTLASCLRRLLPHVEIDGLALTGGVAIDLHVPGARRAVADVDLVARGPASVRPSVTADFLVSHHHARPKWLLQLVDPASRLRIDIFPDVAGAIQRAVLRDVAGVRLLVLARADILRHKLSVLAGPCDPKHVADVIRLGGTPPASVVTRPTVYAQDLDARCVRCAQGGDPAFPLAPKARIHELLGYV